MNLLSPKINILRQICHAIDGFKSSLDTGNRKDANEEDNGIDTQSRGPSIQRSSGLMEQ